jgi:hypothetical protein
LTSLCESVDYVDESRSLWSPAVFVCLCVCVTCVAARVDRTRAQLARASWPDEAAGVGLGLRAWGLCVMGTLRVF